MTERTEAPASRGMKRYVVAAVDDIEEGGRLIVELAGRKIGIFKVDGEFYALLHRCPHLGGPLCDGAIVGLYSGSKPGEIQYDAEAKYLMCPWHGWEFDIKTGQSWWDPQRTRARRLPVHVERGDRVAEDLSGGAVERVPGPFSAETYPVTVEGDYVVISLRSAEQPT